MDDVSVYMNWNRRNIRNNSAAPQMTASETIMKFYQQKLNTITLIKEGFNAGLLYLTESLLLGVSNRSPHIANCVLHFIICILPGNLFCLHNLTRVAFNQEM